MTIVFCFYKIFRNSHRQIFQLDNLVKEGHHIILLDMLGFHGVEPTVDDEFLLRYRVKVSSKKDIIEFKEKLSLQPVIFITNDSYLQKLADTLRLIMRKQDRLISFRIKATIFAYKEDWGLRKAFRRLVEKTNWFPWHKLKHIYNLNHTYFAPDYFMCATNYYLPLKAFLTVKRKNILVVHSDDVNRIIEDKNPVDNTKRIGVFLDQVLPFAYRGKIDPFHYYTNIEKTLKKLQEYYKLDKIVISEHPESEAVKDELNDKYKGFERSRRKSHLLIKNADMVFAHYSTSIGMAIYYQKPVVLLIDNHLRKINHIKNAIHTYEKNLHLPIIDMDEVNCEKLKDNEIHKVAYKTYVTKFMRDNYEVKENSYHYAIKRAVSDLES